MRVDSIISINAHQQHNPHIIEFAGAAAGNTATGKSFEEYLRENMQQSSNQTVSSQPENQLTGLLMGYFTTLKITQKEEEKTKSNAG